MSLCILHVDPNPTYKDQDPEWVYVIDDKHPKYRSLMDYLRRMLEAGVIDDYWTEEFRETDVTEVMLRAINELAPRLKDDEEDGEDIYDGGGEGLDEQHMREAGRIR